MQPRRPAPPKERMGSYTWRYSESEHWVPRCGLRLATTPVPLLVPWRRLRRSATAAACGHVPSFLPSFLPSWRSHRRLLCNGTRRQENSANSPWNNDSMPSSSWGTIPSTPPSVWTQPATARTTRTRWPQLKPTAAELVAAHAIQPDHATVHNPGPVLDSQRPSCTAIECWLTHVAEPTCAT